MTYRYTRTEELYIKVKIKAGKTLTCLNIK